MENRPTGRQKNVTGHSGGVNRRGEGLGTGPVGNSSGYSGRQSGRGSSGGNGPTRSGGGGLMKAIVLLLALTLGGGAGVSGLLGDGSATTTTPAPSGSTGSSYSQGSAQNYPQFDFSGMFAPPAQSTSSTGWLGGSNTGRLNTSVDPSARAKRTTIKGNGKDTVTIMVYMCGTDLESKSAMGTKDLQEMLNAEVGRNVNLLIYTGGCRKWQNTVVSSSVNQIYQIQNGSIRCLESNAGTGSMTSPKTLASFIQYCSKNFPANRNMLILWDHGGGSISGYGYDEKSGSSGAMSLKGLNDALTAGKTTFDFIGFDACLMATTETGLTMAPYADYLIASEETEPGLGWFYTDWLTALSRNTSLSTLELGKMIADDFVSVSAQKCPGQKTTLSVVDLAELESTLPDDFRAFSASTLELLRSDGYAAVSTARAGTREFAASTKIDQVDLVHLALQLGTPESKALADTVLSAVKYNRTSSNMTNAYGLSLYFPYRNRNKVNSAVAAYDAIGLDDTYSDCIRAFATMEVSGQAAAGGTTSPVTTLGGQTYGSNTVGSDLLTEMLTQLLGGSGSSYGITGSTGFFDRSLDIPSAAQYLTENRFDPDALVWSSRGSSYAMRLSEQQWSLVQDLELNVFVDDGEGYIDLGLDNTFAFTAEGDLVGEFDGSWLAIDGQNVAYYYLDTAEGEDGTTITGRVPVMLNDSRAELILVFSPENPKGFLAGARAVYQGETETVAKGITELEVGDTIDFLCDYYHYDGTYSDTYYLGEPHIYTGSEVISNVYTDSACVAAYRFTDIYQNSFWTPVIP